MAERAHDESLAAQPHTHSGFLSFWQCGLGQGAYSLHAGFLLCGAWLSATATLQGYEEDPSLSQQWALWCDYFPLYSSLTFGAILTARSWLFLITFPAYRSLCRIILGLAPPHRLAAESHSSEPPPSPSFQMVCSCPVIPYPWALCYFLHRSDHCPLLSSSLSGLIISSLLLH